MGTNDCKHEGCQGKLITAPQFVVDIIGREVKRYYSEIKEAIFVCDTCECVHRTDGSLIVQSRFAAPGTYFIPCLKKARKFREEVCTALIRERKKYLASPENYELDLLSSNLFATSSLKFLQTHDFIRKGKKGKEIEKFDIIKYLDRYQ